MGQITYLNTSGLSISTFLVSGITCNTKVLHEIYTCNHPLTPLNQYSCGGTCPMQMPAILGTNPCVTGSFTCPWVPSVSHSGWSHPLCIVMAISLGISISEELLKKMKGQRRNLLSELKPVYPKASSHFVLHHTEPVRSSTRTTKTPTSTESLNSHRIITQCDSISFVSLIFNMLWDI